MNGLQKLRLLSLVERRFTDLSEIAVFEFPKLPVVRTGDELTDGDGGVFLRPLVAAVRQKAKSAPEALARRGVAVELKVACPAFARPREPHLTAGVTCTASAKFRVDAELHDEALAVL